jgi:hypothetical protein
MDTQIRLLALKGKAGSRQLSITTPQRRARVIKFLKVNPTVRYGEINLSNHFDDLWLTTKRTNNQK